MHDAFGFAIVFFGGLLLAKIVIYFIFEPKTKAYYRRKKP